MFFSLGNIVEILCKPTIMLNRKAAARASIRNLQIVNQKYKDDIESESIPCHQKKRLSIAAQTVSSSTASSSMESLESTDPAPNPLTILDPELRDFCTRLHITPVAREFHDQKDESDPHLCVSDQSSGIEEESSLMALKTFSNAF